MEKVTYIIPVNEYTDELVKYYETVFKSLAELRATEDFEVFITGPNDVLKKCEKLYKDTKCKMALSLFATDEKDLFIKINDAVMKCTTPYFSVVEFDDSFYPYWNEVVQQYIAQERYSVLLPMVEMFTSDDKLVGLANEIAWDAAFAGEDKLGFVSTDDLLTFRDFHVTGAYIKTEDFISLGRLKSELKIAAWYEFLLRVSNEEMKIFVVPRIGYKHTVLRDGSYMAITTKELSREEGIALIEKAVEPYVKKEKDKKQG